MNNWTLGQVGKTKPIQTQYKPNSKPIKPKTNPKQTQFKPNLSRRSLWRRRKQTQFQNQYMLPPMKINPRRLSAIPALHWVSGGRTWRYQKPDFVIDFLVFHLIILRFGRFCVSLSLEVSLNLCENYGPFNLLFLLEVCF